MSVIILGCGRSGTNLLLEILRGSDELQATSMIEDKNFAKSKCKYPDNYLSKCDTVYFDWSKLKYTLELNPRMKVLWCMRHPNDMCLSKIYRGQPRSLGGDCDTLADDATISGCEKDIRYMWNIHKNLINNYAYRTKTVKMESVILDFDNTIHSVCRFLGISYNPKMENFISRMRNVNKSKRYNTLDKGQVNLYKNWQTLYNGWFVKNNYDMPLLFDNLRDVTEYFNYE